MVAFGHERQAFLRRIEEIGAFGGEQIYVDVVGVHARGSGAVTVGAVDAVSGPQEVGQVLIREHFGSKRSLGMTLGERLHHGYGPRHIGLVEFDYFASLGIEARHRSIDHNRKD